MADKAAFTLIMKKLSSIDKKLVDLEKSALNSEVEIGIIKKQTLNNCQKLDNLSNEVKDIKDKTDLIPQVLEIVQANGQGIEVLSERVDKLE